MHPGWLIGRHQGRQQGGHRSCRSCGAGCRFSSACLAVALQSVPGLAPTDVALAAPRWAGARGECVRACATGTGRRAVIKTCFALVQVHKPVDLIVGTGLCHHNGGFHLDVRELPIWCSPLGRYGCFGSARVVSYSSIAAHCCCI
jgi:hypothetical protein